jgi:hypothetical protein
MDLAREPIVEDRPLAPKRGGANDIDGVDVPERCEPAMEPVRTIAGPGEPNGALVNASAECVSEICDDWSSAPSL